jgi:hypothetical protein
LFIETTAVTRSIVGEIYRTPNTPELIFIDRCELITSKIGATSPNTNVVIGTDQNFDYLKTDEHTKTADLLNNF